MFCNNVLGIYCPKTSDCSTLAMYLPTRGIQPRAQWSKPQRRFCKTLCFSSKKMCPTVLHSSVYRGYAVLDLLSYLTAILLSWNLVVPCFAYTHTYVRFTDFLAEALLVGGYFSHFRSLTWVRTEGQLWGLSAAIVQFRTQLLPSPAVLQVMRAFQHTSSISSFLPSCSPRSSFSVRPNSSSSISKQTLVMAGSYRPLLSSSRINASIGQ